jgi:outer membrane protein assembly factor BamE
MNQRLIVIIALLLSIVTSSACIYRIDIPQGNRIDAETVEKLEPGMSMRQVEFLLGAPAIKDPYHAKQWHYVYYLKRGETGDVYKTVMTLHFTAGLLVLVEGSLLGDPNLL